MTSSSPVMTRLAIAVGVILVIGSPSWGFAKKGPRISVGDDPSMKEGSPELVFIEVADFQCSYCGQGAREVLPFVETQFVDTGKVELIFLDLPLQMHPHAFKAAEAAACAGDQNKFWEMHHHLFANQSDLAPERLPIYAEQLGLDVAAFQKCLSSRRPGAGIREDMRAAEILGITGTPAYLIGRRVAGSEKVEILEVIKGLPPYEHIEEKLNSFLTSGSPAKQ